MIILKDTQMKIREVQDVASMLQGWLKTLDSIDRDKEHLIVIHLNTRLGVKMVEVVSIGVINASLAHPREVFRRAIVGGAVSIILAHNHPSGNCEPSNEDISLTTRINEAGKILHIHLLDHVIFSDTEFYSSREHGYL